jgi:hypothetical protein
MSDHQIIFKEDVIKRNRNYKYVEIQRQTVQVMVCFVWF